MKQRQHHHYCFLSSVIVKILDGKAFYRRGERIIFDSSKHYPFRVGDTYFISFKGWEDWLVDVR